MKKTVRSGEDIICDKFSVLLLEPIPILLCLFNNLGTCYSTSPHNIPLIINSFALIFEPLPEKENRSLCNVSGMNDAMIWLILLVGNKG